MRISDWSSDVCSSDLFNGDGKSDLLWRSLSSGSNVIWRSAGSSTTQAVTRLYGSVWTVAGTGDFDGDSRADVLWRNSANGYNTIWRSASSTTGLAVTARSDEHTSELQSLMRISYAVFCLHNKNNIKSTHNFVNSTL